MWSSRSQVMCASPVAQLRYQSCVCSVGLDYSVAVLSITERNCIFLASCHAAPVVCVRWRPLEDFLLVGCSDGKVFVWQMETGGRGCEDGWGRVTIGCW